MYIYIYIYMNHTQNRWSEVRDCYMSLTSSRILIVKRTISHSFHEVAKIVGPTIVEDELLPVFEELLQYNDEAVSFGVLTHLAEILACMSIEWRQSYLYILKELMENSNGYNWRLREHIAAQIRGLAPLLEMKDVNETLLPIAFDVLKDKVASVRIKALQV
jgi:hypothetical protein